MPKLGKCIMEDAMRPLTLAICRLFRELGAVVTAECSSRWVLLGRVPAPYPKDVLLFLFDFSCISEG